MSTLIHIYSIKRKWLCFLCSVDATEETNRLGRLINHSRREGNTLTRVFEVDGVPHLGFVASRDIHLGEELQYDYGDRRTNTVKSFPWLAN